MINHCKKKSLVLSKRNSMPVIALVIFLCFCIPVKISAQDKDPLYSITKAELRDQIFFLASDELEGRDTGSEGFAIAALYAVTQFKESGLEPLIADKDGKKSFFQSVPFFSYDISNKSVFTISSGAGESQLFHKDRMILFLNQTVGQNIFVDESPVFLGYGIDDPVIGWSDYENVDVRGKVVSCKAGLFSCFSRLHGFKKESRLVQSEWFSRRGSFS